MKTCIKCGVPKLIEDFYIHLTMSDGRLGKCKKCCKDAANIRRCTKLQEILAYDRERGKLPHRIEKVRAYRKTHPEVVARAHKKYANKYPERKKATTIVSNAVRDGKLVKHPCEVCGNPEVEAHHDDYSKPMEIKWLCNDHHKVADKIRRIRESNGV